MREAPSIIARRTLWQSLPEPNFRDIVADNLDQNDRDHLTLARELEKNNFRMIGILISLCTASILLALNLAVGTLGG